MEIKRINSYEDERFSRKALLQHGCFLVEKMPFEVEIISNFEAVIRGENNDMFLKVIEEFRFYAPHITVFYDENRQLVKVYPMVETRRVPINQIQPSQFFVDADKVRAISSFIEKPSDIIIQVKPFESRYISLDGHTRLYYAVMNGWDYVCAVIEDSDECVYDFVREAQSRNIYCPKDMKLVSHSEYEEKWNRFCDELFERTGVE